MLKLNFIKEMMDRIRNATKYSLSSEDKVKVDKKLTKGKVINVGNLVSLRSIGGSPSGGRVNKEVKIGVHNMGDNTKIASVASTAIKNVRYIPNPQDPENGKTMVTYQGGSKEYEFRQSPEEFKDYMDANSKGQYTQNVMRVYNRAPGY